MSTGILCHIVGLNEETQQEFYDMIKNYQNKLIIIDINKISEQIINDNIMNTLYDKYIDYLEKFKDKKTNHNLKTKYQEMERKMTIYWKTKLDYNIQKIVEKNKNSDKKIIVIGKNIHYKNNRIRVNIDAILKYFIKIDPEINATKCITYYLDHNRENIINGEFPLKFLDKNNLITQRTLLQNTFIKLGYVSKSLQHIVKQICLNIDNQDNFNDVKHLYVGTQLKLEPSKKINTFENGQIIAYSHAWLALTSIPNDRQNKVIRGFDNKINMPYMKEQVKNGFDIFNIEGYLYEVDKSDFTYHGNGGIYKFTTTKPVKILKRTFYPNIKEQLDNLPIKKIKF